MGILDEAIREHLELKRQHGADDSELKQLEDEAFGAAERPGGEPASEAPTEFLGQPETAEERAELAGAEEAGAAVGSASRRESAARIADLQEPPEAPAPGPVEREDTGEEAREKAEAEAQAEAETAPEGEPEPAGEEPSVQQPSHTTEEREAIAEQPTEMYDVVEAGEADAPEVEAEEIEVEEEDEDFWNEQRLSDELDQALEAPPQSEPEPEPEEAPEPEAEEAPEPEAAFEEEAEGYGEEEEAETSARRPDDVLEDTPDFLEESPEDDELWFEQKPPKDFDFDD